MAECTKPIAESNHFIVLDRYIKEWEAAESYQSEGDLEREFIKDLVNQGYEHPTGLNTSEALLVNVREQPQALNHVQFSDGEWARCVETWLDSPAMGSWRRPARFRMTTSMILCSMMAGSRTSTCSTRRT